jgi:predicted acylesterase/phospholipase RssA
VLDYTCCASGGSVTRGDGLPGNQPHELPHGRAATLASTAVSQVPRRGADEKPKVGLALSGGGFRASFFHIGVLARLAEFDILRDVEVLSTVSGGSIVGALYYLRVKNLLETTKDVEITRKHYVDLVRKLEEDFRYATDRNIRSLTFANPVKNFRMASPRYSRSDRLGDIYDRLLYKPAWKDKDLALDDEARSDRQLPKGWLSEARIPMRLLKVHPLGDPNRADFDPAVHNETRKAKVPVLMINATSLNSGHAWRFEASRMGEPPPIEPRLREVVEDIDKNVRYARGRYQELTPKRQNFSLGTAVAASACVPSLFHPLSISGLYDGSCVQLVDGGVYDNQGVQALFDTECTHLLLSDAAGQMDDLPNPVTRVPAVAGRSISIYGDSLRDGQLVRAKEPQRAAAVMHLRKGLHPKVVHPRRAQGQAVERNERTRPDSMTDFGVHQEVQEALSNIRTDLDSFTEVEAWSLALDGYRMTSATVEHTPRIDDLIKNRARANENAWNFGVLGPELQNPSPTFMRHLQGARKRFFKPSALVRGLEHAPKILAWLLLAATLFWRREDVRSGALPVWAVLVALVVVAGYLFMGTRLLPRLLSGFLPSFVAPLVLAIPLWLLSLAVLATNRLFLAMGKAHRVIATTAKRRAPEAPRLPAQP